MAPRSVNPRPRPPETSTSVTFFWGLVLLACALLLALALVSYSVEDWPAINELQPNHNWVGVFGTFIAGALGPFLFGRWAALGIVIIVGIWGWTLLRRLDWKRSFILSAWLLGLCVWVSTFMGVGGQLWPGIAQADSFPHSGQFGAWAAEQLGILFGYTGAVVLLLLTLVVGLGLSVAGFAGWFEKRVNTAIDRVSQTKPPRFSWFKKPEHQPESESLDEPDEAAAAAPMSGNGHAAKSVHDMARPASRREKLASLSQLAIQIEDRSGYVYPPLDLFNPPKDDNTGGMTPEDLQRHSELLEKTLATFGVQAKVVRVNPGPVITRFDLEPAPGVKVSRIEALADDIALALRARGLRILAPIPGVAAVGVEMANPKPAIVTFREVAESPMYQQSKSKLTIALGRTVQGDIFCADLATLPHLLIAGTTGSGKSVCVNSIIASILLRATPDDVQFVLIDPKKLELAAYNELRNHHVTHRPDLSEYVVTRPDEAVKVLRSCLTEMERRYDLLAERGSRHLAEYNEAVRVDPGEDERPLPYIVVVIDELADLMVTAQREVEEPIARLAQLARAVGIHLVVATQRPSVDVITGVIKANFPARIAFRVAMKVDSRTILDTNGAEMLLGQGDMLFQHPEEPAPIRVQGALLTSSEIQRTIAHICKQPSPLMKLVLPVEPEDAMESGAGLSLDPSERDPLFHEAAKIVIRTGQGSVSILQRRLKVGYARAARLIDQLERAGIVGPFDGSKARAVLVDEHYFDSLNEQ